MDNPDYHPSLDPTHEHANGWRAHHTLGLFLEEDGWFPHPLPEHNAYRMTYQGSNVEIRCIAQINLAAERLMIYAYAPTKVAEEQRALAAEYLTRANYGLAIGNFEMDWSDGEVRCKSSLDFESETLTIGWIRNAIYPAVHLMNRYFPGLMMVIYGSKTPAEAIQAVE